jgi:predicted HTH domain antitoxin
MTITIPDEIVALSNISSTDFRIEIATYLYEKQRLSIGKAHKLAGLNLIQFQKELLKRNIYLHLDTSDIDKELQNLNQL